MGEYLTTREVAQYLRLNEKKVYALVSEGRLPAARISGKWLFDRAIIDEWVARNTQHPVVGLMQALLDDMIIVQGSDDPLFARLADEFCASAALPVFTTRIGSLAGLDAVARGKAHCALCHIPLAELREVARHGHGLWALHLFTRQQGLLWVPRGPDEPAPGLAELRARGLRVALRQPRSGTHRLLEALLGAEGVALDELETRGPFSGHLELAMALRRGEADVGLGVAAAAAALELGFVPLAQEPFLLVVPSPFAGHPQMLRFLDALLAGIRARGTSLPGYDTAETGRAEALPGLEPALPWADSAQRPPGNERPPG